MRAHFLLIFSKPSAPDMLAAGHLDLEAQLFTSGDRPRSRICRLSKEGRGGDNQARVSLCVKTLVWQAVKSALPAIKGDVILFMVILKHIFVPQRVQVTKNYRSNNSISISSCGRTAVTTKYTYDEGLEAITNRAREALSHTKLAKQSKVADSETMALNSATSSGNTPLRPDVTSASKAWYGADGGSAPRQGNSGLEGQFRHQIKWWQEGGS